MLCLRYSCLFAHSAVQHILLCVFCLFVFVLFTLCFSGLSIFRLPNVYQILSFFKVNSESLVAKWFRPMTSHHKVITINAQIPTLRFHDNLTTALGGGGVKLVTLLLLCGLSISTSKDIYENI